MQKEDYTEKGIRYVRIDKRKARIKFAEGKTIFLIQDNMRLGNAWQGYALFQMKCIQLSAIHLTIM